MYNPVGVWRSKTGRGGGMNNAAISARAATMAASAWRQNNGVAARRGEDKAQQYGGRARAKTTSV